MKNKVILFQGRSSFLDKKIKIAPLALLHLSSFLVKDGFDVKICFDFKEALSQCRDGICLGISAMTGTQIYDGLHLAGLVKTEFRELPVVWGGWHPSILPDSTIENSCVDYVVTGQGEVKFHKLVNFLSNRDGAQTLDTIPGLYYKSKTGVKHVQNCALEPLDKFPRVPYELIKIEDFLIKTEYGDRALPYVSSYGCPHRCAFCIEPVVNLRGWKAFPAERVVDDWIFLKMKYGIDSIAVYDSNFFVDKKRTLDICEGLIKKNAGIKWGNANGRISQIVKFSKDEFKLMQKSGLKMILTGSESTTRESLELLQKDSDVDDIMEFSRLCKEHDIKVLFSYMSGLPWSSASEYNRIKVDDEIEGILMQSEELLKITDKNRIMIYTYTPLPGSALYERAIKCGYIEPKNLIEWSKISYTPDDIFKVSCGHRWLAKYQYNTITMLEQYIFSLLDADSYELVLKYLNNLFFRVVFGMLFKLFRAIARYRLSHRFFSFPIDYWIFVQARKIVKI